MKNPFTIHRVNEFVDNKEKIVEINYLGQAIAHAFLYMDEVYFHFINDQPLIQAGEWKYLDKISERLKQDDMEFLKKCYKNVSAVR